MVRKLRGIDVIGPLAGKYVPFCVNVKTDYLDLSVKMAKKLKGKRNLGSVPLGQGKILLILFMAEITLISISDSTITGAIECLHA